MIIDEQSDHRFVISVLIQDKVGVLHNITKTIFDLKGNISEIRQTVVCGFFHLIFESIHPTDVTRELLRQKLNEALNGAAGIVVLDNPEKCEEPVPQGSRFIIMCRGEDKPGCIYKISSFLVDQGINIEDWFVEREGNQVSYVVKIVIPDQLDFRKLQAEFRETVNRELEFTSMLCHENIFRATNEIGPIKALLEQNRS